MSHSLLIRFAGLHYVASFKANVYGDYSDTLRRLKGKAAAVLQAALITVISYTLLIQLLSVLFLFERNTVSSK